MKKKLELEIAETEGLGVYLKKAGIYPKPSVRAKKKKESKSAEVKPPKGKIEAALVNPKAKVEGE